MGKGVLGYFRDRDALVGGSGHAVGGMRGRRGIGLDSVRLEGVAHRCPCGQPDVVETAPRLEDGTPFPTLYYLTCPRLASALGRLEGEGVMREMTQRLGTDAELAAGHRRAHEAYLAERDAIEPLGTSSLPCQRPI